KALGKTPETLNADYHRQIAIRLSPFWDYLIETYDRNTPSTVPETISQAFNITQQYVLADNVYAFRRLRQEFTTQPVLKLTYTDLAQSNSLGLPVLIVGESGLGKST